MTSLKPAVQWGSELVFEDEGSRFRADLCCELWNDRLADRPFGIRNRSRVCILQRTWSYQSGNKHRRCRQMRKDAYLMGALLRHQPIRPEPCAAWFHRLRSR